jgi:hypothetical protein
VQGRQRHPSGEQSAVNGQRKLTRSLGGNQRPAKPSTASPISETSPRPRGPQRGETSARRAPRCPTRPTCAELAPVRPATMPCASSRSAAFASTGHAASGCWARL